MSPRLRDPNPLNLRLSEPIPLIRHPAQVYLLSLGKRTHETVKQSLDVMAGIVTNGECDYLTLDWSKLRYQHTAAIRTELLERYAPGTVNRMLCALRRVLKEAFRLDLIDPYDYAKAVDIASVRESRKLRGRTLSASEISALMQVCKEEGGNLGARDLALIALLRGCGLRRTEVVNLKLKDYSPEQGSLEICNGKGGKDRMVYLPDSAITYLEDWLALRGNRPGALICPIRRGGAIEYRHMISNAC